MPKDFAAKKTKRRNATRFEDVGDTSGSFKTILLSTVFGITLTLVAVYFYQNSASLEQEPAITEQPKQKPSAKSRYKAVPADELEKNEFSFHEELEKKKIEVETPKITAPKSQNKPQLIMQCGSFRKISAAEQLRAQIGMNGFEAHIKTTTENNGTWHRVRLGPYESKRQAERDRHQLERNNINNCQIW